MSSDVESCPVLTEALVLSPAPKRTATIDSTTLAESSGGLAFEVKLAESPRHTSAHMPLHFLSPSAKGNQNDLATPLTPESITEKLKRAEERRLSLEQLRATLLAAENSRPVEVSKIKDQQAEGKRLKVRLIGRMSKISFVEFRKQTEEKLQKKLESAKENRERALQAKVEKAKAPIEKGLASVQQNLAKLEEERQLLQEKINQQLNTAETSKARPRSLVHTFLFSVSVQIDKSS